MVGIKTIKIVFCFVGLGILFTACAGNKGAESGLAALNNSIHTIKMEMENFEIGFDGGEFPDTYEEYINSLQYLDEIENKMQAALTTAAIVEAHEAWDKELNIIYNILMEKLSAEDRENLRAEERLWLAERDEKADRALARGGSQGEADYYYILFDMTKTRTLELISCFFTDGWQPVGVQQSIPDVLVQNAPALLSRYQDVPLPENFEFVICTSGDLNGDGKEDIAVVIEEFIEDYDCPRTLYILISQPGGSYKVAWQVNKMMGRFDGGVYGDPLEGVSIAGGTLTIAHYGGSSDRWGFTSSYKIKGGNLILTKAEQLEASTLTGRGTCVIYFPETGVIEERSVTYEGDKYHNLLLFEDSTPPGQIFTVEDSFPNIWGLERENGHYPPLPSLYRIAYGEAVWEKLNLSPTQALDMVQQKLYPGLSKAAHPYSPEIMDNYNKLLAYEVPAYSYVGERESLLYIGQSDPYRGEDCYHRISAYDFIEKESKTIYVDDLTGEIVVQEY